MGSGLASGSGRNDDGNSESVGSGRGSARVAVIAVHGVADQQAGETARALADLLVVAGPKAQPGGPHFAVTESDALGLRVPTLAPSPQAHAIWTAAPRTAELPLKKRLAKAWRQSTGSDLYRTPAGRYARAAPATGVAPAPDLSQPDIELTDFLLAQSLRNETPDAVYDTQRLGLRRQGAATGAAPDSAQTVHIYEMYWADLSRLAGNLPRIATELFTLIARLSQLGRDTVAAATRQFRADAAPSSVWESLDMTQAALDWMFSRVLAQLMMVLLIVVLLIVPLGWLAGQELWQSRVFVTLSCVLPAGLWLALVYRWAPGRALALLGAALALLVAVLLVRHAPRPPLLGAFWVLLLGLLAHWLLSLCDTRFPLTRVVGGALATAALLTALLTGLGVFPGDGAMLAARDTLTDPLLLFVIGGLRAMELLLLGTLLCWLAFAPVMLTWYFLGLRCEGSRGYAGDATVATGRLGLFVSMAFFMTLVMAVWALLHPLLVGSVADLLYEPFFFKPAEAVTVRSAANFLDIRYANTTETFSLLAMQLFAVVMYLVIGLLPSLLAELQWLPPQARALGLWLTRTYRYLDLMLKLLIGAAVMAVVLVALDLWFSHWNDYPVPELEDLMRWVRNQSQDALSPLTLALTAASATAAITALGGLLSRYLPGLRAPLDVALDVDNHFREFPRQGIPRSRIFSRYAALLRHVHEQGYERIVIVAHSQGSVITTELLRYLNARAAQPDDHGEAAELGRALAGRVFLLTAGCPLRQLYASRFPMLYPWVMRPQPAQTVRPQPQSQPPGARPLVGPGAADIGVQRWVNVYATGDYVGRWLWSRPPDPARDRSDTILDDNGDAAGVYEPAHPAPAATALALAQLGQPGAQFDVCLGSGAHTHYFHTDQQLVAALVDGLLTIPAKSAA
jgi:hypothetical protein